MTWCSFIFQVYSAVNNSNIFQTPFTLLHQAIFSLQVYQHSISFSSQTHVWVWGQVTNKQLVLVEKNYTLLLSISGLYSFSPFLMAEENKLDPIVTIYEEDLPVITRRRGCTLRVQITSVLDSDFQLGLLPVSFFSCLFYFKFTILLNFTRGKMPDRLKISCSTFLD